VKTVAVGDIHGCLEQLKALIDHVHRRYGHEIKWVFLGDYVDRGLLSMPTVEFLRRFPGSHDDVTFLMGNHDWMLLQGFDLWPNVYGGGQETVKSYGGVLPPEHRKWLEETKLYLEQPLNSGYVRVFVHAGINRDVPMLVQDREVLLWVRDEFYAQHGIVDERYVVHGHTPQPHLRFPQVLADRCNVDTGCCFGGVLSAAVFIDNIEWPVECVNHLGEHATVQRIGGDFKQIYIRWRS